MLPSPYYRVVLPAAIPLYNSCNMGRLVVFRTFPVVPDEGHLPVHLCILYLNNISEVQSYIHPADLLSDHIHLQ